nr:hypothetical protein [Sedimentitalea sp. CY04]
MATGHIPGFLPGADGSDPLFTGMVVFTILLVLLIGAFYFKLHAIPEHMAHEDNHTQMQVIGILALLALFTHNNMFWVIALLVAAFRMPDFLTPLQSIARSLDSLNRREQLASGNAGLDKPRSAATSDVAQQQTKGETDA